MKKLLFTHRNYWLPKPVLTVLLLVIIYTLTGIQQAQAQDKPFEKLKKAADNQATVKSQLSAVSIPKTSSTLKTVSKAPIPYRTIEPKDAAGRTIKPDEMVTLNNGQRMTGREYKAKINELERALNTKGYTSQTKGREVVSKTVTPASTLDGKRSMEPAPLKALRNDADLKKFMDPTRKSGDIVLKAYADYSDAEKRELNSVRMENENGQLVAKKLAKPIAAAFMAVNPNAIKTINETSAKEWSFGSSSTFKAGIRGELTRYAKLYQFNPQHPEQSKTEFRLTAKGKVYGTLFNHSMDLFNASAVYYSPVDVSKNMTLKVVISAVGLTVLNLDKSYQQVKTISQSVAKNFDKSFPIRFPIIGPVSFSGKIGIKGMVGFDFEGNLYRTFINVIATPVADISGYAEAGISVGIAGLGVGGRLTFVKGSLDLQGFAGIIFQNPEQLVAIVNYYVGYDLQMLKGELYAYASVGICPFCYEPSVSIFDWDGFVRSGTLAEGSKQYVIDNTRSSIPPLVVSR